MIANDENTTYVLFLYEDIQWSGGQTVVGFNTGDGTNSFTIPESMTSDGVLNLHQTSNVGLPGTYIYRVDQLEVVEIEGM